MCPDLWPDLWLGEGILGWVKGSTTSESVTIVSGLSNSFSQVVYPLKGII